MPVNPSPCSGPGCRARRGVVELGQQLFGGERAEDALLGVAEPAQPLGRSIFMSIEGGVKSPRGVINA